MSAATHPVDDVRRAYDAMAPFYDGFTAHHDYGAWTTIVEALATAAGLRGRRLLDVACGTGKSFEPFLARGWDVVGCDLSPAMLARAAERAGGRAVLEVRDIRALPVLGSFDLVLALDDVVNYLMPGELEPAFASLRRNLAPGGVVVFDANTLAAYRSFFATAAVVRDGDDVLVWDGRADPAAAAGAVAEAELLAFSPDADGRWSLVRSRHRQHHHPRPAIERALGAAGLGWRAVHGMHLDGAVDAGLDELAHSKALYVARERAPQRG
jgi:SAM-dependent methyltransferase